MKVVILAGGFGTRISEESQFRPKPMIEIGGKPILWHIMKIYSHYGFNDFIICCGYKGYYIKEYFANYFLHESDVTFDFREGERKIIHAQHTEPWRVTLVDTGYDTMTGGRLKRIEQYVGDSAFMMTYGDGVSDVDIGKLLAFHETQGKIATVTAIRPAGRYGALSFDAETKRVEAFQEKPLGDGNFVSGGFFVFEPKIFGLLENDATVLELEPLKRLAENGELMAYRHDGFWQSMDTLRDKKLLEKLWEMGNAPWKVWE